MVLDLGQAPQGFGAVMGAGLGFLPREAVRAQHPEVAAVDLQPFDVHLVVRPARQVEIVAQVKGLVCAVAAAILGQQPLDRGALVARHPQRAPLHDQRGQVAAHGLIGMGQFVSRSKRQRDLAARSCVLRGHGVISRSVQWAGTEV
jgi:hypothetical protein